MNPETKQASTCLVQVEVKEEKQDVVSTLIHAIAIHFLGQNLVGTSNHRKILKNLKCTSMSNFKWYYDMFIARVFTQDDCSQQHWKEQFINGLPNFIAEKVYTSLQKNYKHNNPWNDITYGQLTSIIIECSLDTCNEIIVQSKVQK